MPKLKDSEGTIINLCSKIKLDLESPQQFGKIPQRDLGKLKKNGTTVSKRRGKSNNIYTITYQPEDVEY